MEHIKFAFQFTQNILFSSAGPTFTPDKYPNLTGQKWLVTGATSGIGLETAKILAEKGAELWIIGRNAQKLDSVQQQIQSLVNGASVHTLIIDFADLSTVKPAVKILRQQTNYLDGIIHNAGVMYTHPDVKTAQGIEMTVGVNNVASQLLQNLLDPLIEDRPAGRIVWLSSVAHIYAPIGGFNLSVLSRGSGGLLYSMSKAWNYFQAIQWTIRHPRSSVKSITVHPGVIKSEITRTTPWFQYLVIRLAAYDITMGILAPLYAALYPDIKNNDYIVPFGRSGPVRPDIYKAARSDQGEATIDWINEKVKNYQ